MTAYPTWTPASRPGIVPLQPLGFGTILGRSFSALRHNPRVLLGFALTVQALAAIVATAAIVGVGVLMFSRLATLRPGSDDFETVMIGSVVLTAIIAFIVSLAATALGVIVQGVVVAEVIHAVLAEKLTLGRLWARVRPVAWRLIGYSAMILLAILLVLGAAIALFAVLAIAIGGFAFIPMLVIGLASIPLWLWLSTKLVLVPAAIVVERATIRGAIARSWSLIRGRFWPALGITLIIGAVFGALAQVVGIPLSLVTTGVTTILSPTGDDDVAAIVSLIVVSVLTQVVTFLIQSISLVVSATASALIYVDCRMRREGLDLDLLAYVEQRDAGRADLPDPYLQHIGRVLAPRWPAPVGYPTGYPASPASPAPAYPAAVYPAPASQPLSAPAYPAPAPAPARPAPAAWPAPRPDTVLDPPSTPAPATETEPDAAPTSTQWIAPGAAPGQTSGSDRP